MKKKDIVCKNCGNDTDFYVKERYTGTCNACFRTDNEVPDNTEMYDAATHKLTSKFVYCADCNCKVCKIENIDDFY